ncbi:AAA family ATPase [Flavobacterium sp. HXWNR29]|uniref:AAA family ATPase n=1 Tax=Flavobacterium odoriferum TaxID=2946604 RepID=UPI0021CB754F|nr:AAA family ATPase [Flavobacterium sp. HXWNR29]MCU4188628.1 AAA family ATPase [Flavobacterium sp. HXWNR29]
MENLTELKNTLIKELGSENKNNQFIIKTANEWIEGAKARPKPKMLFGELWFENEVGILFSDTNLGKSIITVQIAVNIAAGSSSCGLQNEVEPQMVIYFDFELSDKQFENRYSNDYAEHYQFPSNFIRAEINDEYMCNNIVDFEKEFIKSLEATIIENDVKVIIIDNLTYLKNETEKAKDALSLMKELKALKNKHNLSMLILAHTPKRDSSKPLTKNDLSGSKMLINFCDSAFAIGESSSEKGLKYIKQIKQRNTEQRYGAENVILCEIEKTNSFLQFSFMDFGNEYEHLKTVEIANKDDRNDLVLELHNQGKSNVAIADELSLSEGTIRYILKKLKS